MPSLLTSVLVSSLTSVCAAGESLVPPDAPQIFCSSLVRLEHLTDPASPTGKTARFDRILDMPGKGYRWDNPGALISFRTDADKVGVILHFSDRHISSSARNPAGRYRIDGVNRPEWTFRTTQTDVLRSPETVIAELRSPSPRTFHTYELILPYGDAVEFQGLRLPDNARLENFPKQQKPRYVAYGDSITQGFTASEESKTYAFLLAEKKGWQLLNMGFGGRSSTPSDGPVIASLDPAVVTVLMGGNDWQGGVPVETYRSRMQDFLSGLRRGNPTLPVFLITPLWVPPSWRPEKAVADLEEYRRVLRELVVSLADPHLHLIEGPDLIDHDPALLDSVVVHPNDRGFAQMAERLDGAIPALPTGSAPSVRFFPPPSLFQSCASESPSPDSSL